MERTDKVVGHVDSGLADIVREYYRRSDAKDPSGIDLFRDDFEFYFPRFGTSRGKTQFQEFRRGLRETVDELRHPQEHLEVTEVGAKVFVEGITEGRIGERTWRGGETPGGRFCAVFEFTGELIARMWIYLDPDYVGDPAGAVSWPPSDERGW